MERRTFTQTITLNVVASNPIKRAECEIIYRLDDEPVYEKCESLFLMTESGTIVETHETKPVYIYQALDDFLDSSFQEMCEDNEQKLITSLREIQWN